MKDDTLTMLGKPIPCGQAVGRDAIHIAVVPVLVGDCFQPGEHAAVKAGTIVKPAGDFGLQAVGIVDPYLNRPVAQGQRCWLYLYPGTITSLRHEWTHPAFEDQADLTEKDDAYRRAMVWLMGFATEFNDEEYGDLTPKQLIAAAKEYLRTGDEHVLPFDTPQRANSAEDMATFWQHFQTLTGIVPNVVGDRMYFFRCSC